MSVNVMLRKGAFVIRKFAPEILTYGGLAAMIGGTVIACKQTPKAMEIISDAKETMKGIENKEKLAAENGGQVVRKVYNEETKSWEEQRVTYSDEDFRNAKGTVYKKTGLDVLKTYAVPAGLIIGGVASVLSGHGIMRKRNAVAVATIGSLLEGIRKYRGNVIDELGEAADKRFRFGKPAMNKIETVDAETGEITEEAQVAGGFSDFPEGDPRFLLYNKANCPDFYKGNLLMDLTELKSAQCQCNDKLRLYGHLTVNEARDIIGAKAIPEGLDNGWVIDGDGDGYVDFGIFDRVSGEPKSWVFDLVYEEQGIPVEFNIDGNIKGYMHRPRNAR